MRIVAVISVLLSIFLAAEQASAQAALGRSGQNIYGWRGGGGGNIFYGKSRHEARQVGSGNIYNMTGGRNFFSGFGRSYFSGSGSSYFGSNVVSGSSGRSSGSRARNRWASDEADRRMIQAMDDQYAERRREITVSDSRGLIGRF